MTTDRSWALILADRTTMVAVLDSLEPGLRAAIAAILEASDTVPAELAGADRPARRASPWVTPHRRTLHP